MDHLPQPLNAAGPPIDIPFVADVPWDNQDFAGFPSRNGFPVTKKGALLPDYISSDRLASLLQSWLYFGLLTEIFGDKFNQEEFCREQDVHSSQTSSRVIDSTPLEPLFREWTQPFTEKQYFRWRQISRDDIWLERTEHLTKLLKIVYRTRDSVNETAASRTSPLPQILLSIEILCLTIGYFLGRLNYPRGLDLLWNLRNYPTSQSKDPSILDVEGYFNSQKKVSETPAQGLISKRMQSSGWCPFLIGSLSKTFDLATLYYISRIRRPDVRHISHALCTPNACIANNVNEDEYHNRHVEDHCSCHLISASEDNRNKMIDIIKDGGVPLVDVIEAPHGSVELRIREHKMGMGYFAISHVWSDGLGNPNSNALPLCQLQRLAGLLDRHPKSSNALRAGAQKKTQLFWMDTLCIPPARKGDPDYDLRLKCIERMGRIYAGAWRVLVLDSGLQQTRLATSSTNENLVQLVCCAWNQRCWTLQEGAIGPAVSFDFNDGFFDPLPDVKGPTIEVADEAEAAQSRILGLAKPSKPWSIFTASTGMPGISCKEVLVSRLRYYLLTSIQVSLSSGAKQMTNLQIEEGAEPDEGRLLKQFTSIWNELQRRSTTKPEDLWVILANLLDFRARDLMKIKEDRRLREIFLSSPRISRSVLFNRGSRMDSTIFSADRWIPSRIGGVNLEHTRFLLPLEGWMLCQEERFGSAEVISITPAIVPTSSMILEINPKSESVPSVHLRIEFIRDLNDTFVRTGYDSSCIIIDDEDYGDDDDKSDVASSRSCNGALVHVLQRDTSNPTPDPSPARTYSQRMKDSVSRRTFPESQQPYDTTSSLEDHYVIYDCPVRIELLPSKSLSTKPSSSASLDDSCTPPVKFPTSWPKGIDCDIIGREIPPARYTQDDTLNCATSQWTRRHWREDSNTTFTGKILKSWTLWIAMGELDGAAPLQRRPYYPADRVRKYGDPPHYWKFRLIAFIAPVVSGVVILATQYPSFDHWLWKYGLALHWSVVLFLVVETFTSWREYVEFVFVFVYFLAVLTIPILYLVRLGGHITLPEKEARFVFISFALSYLYMLVWRLLANRLGDKFGYQRWLATFDDYNEDVNTRKRK